MHRLAVFDIDGVLADERHRTDYALRKEWGDYFNPERVKKDKVWPQGRLAYENELLADPHTDVAYLTGRHEIIRPVTQKWLARKGFAKATLIMRNDRHSTRNGWPLGRWKAGILAELVHIYDLVVFYDDDPAVCEAARAVPGVQVRHCTWYLKPERLVRRAVA